MSLAHEIVEAINGGAAEGREVLCEMVVLVVRDGVRAEEPHAHADPTAPGPRSFNVVAFAIPFVLMGVVLVFLFPFVGMLMFAAAGVMLVWGLVATMFVRR